MRGQRTQKEALEVRYGYLRSQLEGVDRDFRELQRIVGVHFIPSRPETLQEIIDKFVEKEQRVASLQKYWSLQNDEIEKLEQECAEMQAACDAEEARLAAERGDKSSTKTYSEDALEE